ncbi:MAG: hypothetical protein JGK38_23900 [Microcoleus sp. PH2017_15_JOR_U_A]|uniref:hypothetical protein n=1 Tax=unclassified Microcoleus TaxID=2642155 RepID=UPI001D44434D|nr:MULTISPECIES: hypothetical protein [unclassified Microcoleus]MCC3473303.1 hypothetical protein [Microcoleus sp. PH2017_13_LAR_U_A]MCC3486531.1 hypothetical protein [Microcoleus sp. PH2017_14_LAR_D_A]MCC3499601.1 hypothetical protein [Microcoleus sp. PH2017_15_JOR_U_A]MCC3600172.1 hypothetical protein [Microcoleus sp. PH2017_26_ELK_O_A]MCC3623173.1 hypothetical protein [Microcoleus sp. PH2017_36_ELK_O_B]
MAAFNNGTGGTLAGITSVEDWFTGCVNFLLSQQINSARNPTNIKNLDRTINSSGAMSGSLVVPVTMSAGSGGNLAIAAATYLTGVVWTAPSGGDAAPSNEVIALIDAARRIRLIELDTTKNPTNANYITDLSFAMGSTSVGGTTNGTCTIRWSGFPLDLTVAANGDSTYSGRPYLN